MCDDVREVLKGHGWEQGVIIRGVDNEFLASVHFEANKDHDYLVISQTCDLINPSFDKEPYFEVLRLSIIDEKPDPQYVGGKNSREIQFDADIDGVDTFYRALPFERIFVKRQWLLNNNPFVTVPENTKKTICSWVAKRYMRAAFPDSYDKRWKKRKSQIERIIKSMPFVREIYIKLSTFSELYDVQDYIIEIKLLMDVDKFKDTETYQNYRQAVKRLDAQFNMCIGIDLQAIDLVALDDVLLCDLDEFDRWDYSYLSYREPDEHGSPIAI